MTDRPDAVSRPEQESETPRVDGRAFDYDSYGYTMKPNGQFVDADFARQLERELAALTARERDALDAKRYRWIRDESRDFDPGPGKESPWPVYGINGTDCYPIFDTELDTAIDAAMASTGGS